MIERLREKIGALDWALGADNELLPNAFPAERVKETLAALGKIEEASLPAVASDLQFHKSTLTDASLALAEADAEGGHELILRGIAEANLVIDQIGVRYPEWADAAPPKDVRPVNVPVKRHEKEIVELRREIEALRAALEELRRNPKVIQVQVLGDITLNILTRVRTIAISFSGQLFPVEWLDKLLEGLTAWPAKLAKAIADSRAVLGDAIRGFEWALRLTERLVELFERFVRTVDRTDYNPAMAIIPAGVFAMGTPDRKSDADRALFRAHGGTDEEWGGLYVGDKDERPFHEVRIARFALGRYPVTFEEYDRFAEEVGRPRPDDHGWGRARRPAIHVSWQDAQAYVDWLSQMTGRVYRLPSEAEWEYACRAGTRTNYHWGNRKPTREDANFGQNVKMTTEVGRYPANAFGLHDMHGNLDEWVADVWHHSYKGAPADGSAWTDGRRSNSRVVRGASWGNKPEFLRAAYRVSSFTGYHRSNNGFRVARALP